MPSRRTESTDSPEILIPRPELDTIKKESTNEGNDRRETGGVLLGRRVSESEIFCIAATRPGPEAEQHQAQFAPDTDFAQSIIDDYRTAYDVVWIGTWHKHPGSMNRLSNGDIRQMREFVQDPELLDEIVAIVTTFEDDVLTLNPFYMDQSLEARRTKVEIIDDIDKYQKQLAHEGDDRQTRHGNNQPSEPTSDDRSIHTPRSLAHLRRHSKLKKRFKRLAYQYFR